jgi:hypothetical protein
MKRPSDTTTTVIIAALRTYVAQAFRLVQAGGLLFYVRGGFPAG